MSNIHTTEAKSSEFYAKKIDSQGIEHIDTLKDENQFFVEEHLEEEIEAIIVDPLPKNPKVRLRYTTKEKLEAVKLAEQSSNRQASKLLTIDESCIRKWRHRKEQLENSVQSCKLAKREPSIHEDMEVCDTEIVYEIQTEVGNESVPEPIREIRTRKSYSSSEKLDVIAYAEIAGNRHAGKVYQIDESCIRKWRNQKELLIQINEERGTKRKPNLRFPEVEAELKKFVLKKLDEGITLKPSEIKAESVRIANQLNISKFKGTSSYIFKFMERYHFPSRRSKNQLSSKTPKKEEKRDESFVTEL